MKQVVDLLVVGLTVHHHGSEAFRDKSLAELVRPFASYPLERHVDHLHDGDSSADRGSSYVGQVRVDVHVMVRNDGAKVSPELLRLGELEPCTWGLLYSYYAVKGRRGSREWSWHGCRAYRCSYMCNRHGTRVPAVRSWGKAICSAGMEWNGMVTSP